MARTIYRDGGTTFGSLLAGSEGQVILTLACTSLEDETTMRYTVLTGVSTSDPAALGDQVDAGEVSCDGAVVEDKFVVPRGQRVTVNLTETDDVDQGYAIARNG